MRGRVSYPVYVVYSIYTPGPRHATLKIALMRCLEAVHFGSSDHSSRLLGVFSVKAPQIGSFSVGVALVMVLHLPGQRGHMDIGFIRSAPLKTLKSRNPGNHSSTSASTLSTISQSSCVPLIVMGTMISKVLTCRGHNSRR